MASRRVDAIDAYLKCRNGRRVSTVGRNHCNLPPYDCNPSLRTHSCFVTFDQSRSAWRRQKGFGVESVFTFLGVVKRAGEASRFAGAMGLKSDLSCRRAASSTISKMSALFVISAAIAKVLASIDPTLTKSSQRVRQAWAFWKHRRTSFANASNEL